MGLIVRHWFRELRSITLSSLCEQVVVREWFVDSWWDVLPPLCSTVDVMCCQCLVDSGCNVLPMFGRIGEQLVRCVASVLWTAHVMCYQCLADSWYDVLPVFGRQLMWCVVLPVFGGQLMCYVASVCGTFDVLCCQCLAESQCNCCVHVLQPLLSTWWRKCCTQMRGLSRMMVRLNAYLIIAPLSPTLFICCYCGSETNVKPV